MHQGFSTYSTSEALQKWVQVAICFHGRTTFLCIHSIQHGVDQGITLHQALLDLSLNTHVKTHSVTGNVGYQKSPCLVKRKQGSLFCFLTVVG